IVLVGERELGALAVRGLGDAVGDRAVGEQAGDENALAGEKTHACSPKMLGRLYLAAMRGALISAILLACGLAGCGRVWNDPYPAEDRGKNIYYSFFVERPRHFDPAQSYTSDEYDIIQQIYEPPLQYHYLKRPYELIPATATEVPHPKYYDASGRPLSAEADAARVAYSEYDVHIREGILYQPHPAFAKDDKGQALYLSLPDSEIRSKYKLSDFPKTGTRELTADDYVYEIKRLAHPQVVSPI